MARRNKKRNRKPRRGVLLIVVLSLLVLFLMIAITYMVVASKFRASAEEHARADLAASTPRMLLDEAMYQVLREPGNSQSVVTGSSLLRDLYGRPSGTGKITSAAAVANTSNEFITLNVTMSLTVESGAPPAAVNDALNGLVLTVLSGPAAGHSTRIVDYDASGNQLIVEPLAAPDELPVTLSDLSNRDFIINGAPFSTGGTQYDTSASPPTAVADSSGNPLILTPNYAALIASGGETAASLEPKVGNANESYDAVDFANMYLARVPPTYDNSPSGRIIPSFHRPALFRYWTSQGKLSDINFKRRVSLRPLVEDHPNFSGTNPSSTGFDPINGPWDVDNDSDGYPDSIWIDLGFPAQTAADGRMYKPLFAILCVDLDGRLNVNAQGSVWNHTSSSVTNSGLAGNSTTVSDLPSGQGYGPAEINLSSVLGSEYTTIINGRYGGDGKPGVAGNDPLSQLDEVGMPGAWPPGGPTTYNAPSDVWGRRSIGLNHAGHPLFEYSDSGAASYSELVDDPYELNLSGRHPEGNETSAADTPYTPAELERLLRYYDTDSSLLPDRLLTNGSTAFGNDDIRRMITTRSFSLPVSNSQLLLRNFRQRLSSGGASNIETQLRTMLPWEIIQGQKMDINRLFGTADRSTATPTVWNGTGLSGFDGRTSSFENNTSNNPPSPSYVYARHLYCLMMMLMDNSYIGGAGTQQRSTVARQVAQWAVNVVDFRDQDANMTLFIYDEDPFDGWSVSSSSPRVWGAEYPELLLTETLAFHDRGVRDTNREKVNPNENLDPNMNPDPPSRRIDFDPTKDDEVYDEDLDQFLIPKGSLFLELFCPRDPNPTQQVALPQELYAGGQLNLALTSPPDGNNLSHPVWRVVIAPPNSTSASPISQPDTINPDSIERIVWFTNPGSVAELQKYPQWNKIYHFQQGTQQMAPSSYLVVGPRPKTHVGSKLNGGRLAASSQAFSLAGGIFTAFDRSGSSNVPGGVTQARAMVCAAPPPESWTEANYGSGGGDGTAPLGIGINISEPLPSSSTYYREPTHQPAASGYPVTAGNATKIAYGTPEELDDPTNPPASPSLTMPDTPFAPNAELPDSKTGTYPNGALGLSVAYLQRLAIPQQAHHLTNNPYITIDQASIDLTVFNGEDRQPDPWPPAGKDGIGSFDPDDPDPYSAAPTERFDTRQRGQLSGGTPTANLWEQVDTPSEVTTVPGAGVDYVDYDIVHTLGYLNQTLGTPRTTPAGFQGAPGQTPFPWLMFSGRPFASSLELLLVPSSSPSQLLREFTLYQPTDPYATSAGSPNRPFGHLLGFFQSSTNASSSPNFFRLLDFVETRSPFAGTRNWYQPGNLPAAGTVAELRVPFNYMSRFRDPGRINLNTIHDERVFQALMANFPEMATSAFWSEFQQSLQGYNGGNPGDFPSEYANPFRLAGHAQLMPTTNMQRKEVDATLLRSRPSSPTQPLFAAGNVNNSPAYRDPTRDPFFQYEGLRRLPNLVTTQSNVFAVWITVGYFEVTNVPTPNAAVYPDGLMLGPELGSDTGETERHRAFYMIDRSIPVAFEPGQNHNVDRAVILRRFLE